MLSIEVKDLYKNYMSAKSGKFAGIGSINKSGEPAGGVTFSVETGELFGLIGPDGAGKTTIFRLLTTLLLPGSGTAMVDGLDIVTDYKLIRNRVGYMPGRFSLYPDLSVEENLNLFAKVLTQPLKKTII